MAKSMAGINPGAYDIGDINQPIKPYMGSTDWPSGKINFDSGLLQKFMDYFGQAWNKGGQSPFNTNAGLGMYDSDLLQKLTGRVTSDLTNPNASLEMGLARDRITGSGNAAKQGLANMLAGYGAGTRLSGPGMAMQNQLGRDIMKNESDAYRDISIDTVKRAIANAMGLEGMKGGFYESSKGRELANAGLNKDWEAGQNNYLAQLMQMLGPNLLGFGNADVGAQQQTFTNELGIASGKNAEAEKNWNLKEQYGNQMGDYWNLIKKLGKWGYGGGGGGSPVSNVPQWNY